MANILDRVRLKMQKPQAGTNLPADFVTKNIIREDSKPRVTRMGGTEGYIHASALANDFCARQYFYSNEQQMRIHETLRGSLQITFEIGKAVDAHVKKQMINALGGRNVWGNWTCNYCEHIEKGFKPRQACSVCGKNVFRYEEVVLRDNDNNVVGSPDLFYKYEDTFVPQETKSISGKQLDLVIAANKPKYEHLCQALLYHRLGLINGFKMNNIVPILYVNKENNFKVPYVQFNVDATDKFNQNLIDNMLAEAHKFKVGMDQGIPPARFCLRITDAKAKACPFSVDCFKDARGV